MLKIPLTEHVYDVFDQFMAVRKGDLIALCALNEALRVQSGIAHKFYVSEHHQLESDYMEFFAEYLSPVPSYEVGSHNTLPYKGSIWIYFEHLYRAHGIYPFQGVPVIPCTRQYKVCIAPLVDAVYNPDRNWSFDTTSLLAKILKKYGSDVVVVGTRDILYLQKVFPQAAFRVGDIRQTCETILSSEVFIGGDTGTTHFAAVMPHEFPRSVFAIYGDKSALRHKPIENQLLKWYNAFFIEPAAKELRMSYAPHVRKGRELYLMENAQSLTKKQGDSIATILKG